MGGKVWIQKTRQPVLQDCLSENFKDDHHIIFGDQNETWLQFKQDHDDWEWDDGSFKHKSLDYKDFQADLWNKSGQQICNFYNKSGAKNIQFKVRTEDDDKMIYKTMSSEYQIYFVIDATGSMKVDIEKARKSVRDMANQQFAKKIKVTFYRDHDVKDLNLIETYPA